MALRLSGGHQLPEKPKGGGEAADLEASFREFSAHLSDPRYLADPVPGIRGAGGGGRGRGQQPTIDEQGRRGVHSDRRATPKRRGGRGGGGAHGQGDVQPGGVYTPNPDI